jgi:hypothetical protein
MARAFVAASSQYLEIASAILTAPPVTLACWALPSASAFAAMCVANNGSTQNYLAIYCSGGNLVARANDGGAATGSGKAFTASQWNHFAGVFASTTSRTSYVNGVAGSTESTASTPSGINRTAIGRLSSSSPAGSYFDGSLAEAAIWNIALTATDLAALAAGVSPLLVRPDALVAYWPILGQYSPEIDIRAHNDVTVNGATAAAHPRMFWPVGPQRMRYGGPPPRKGQMFQCF